MIELMCMTMLNITNIFKMHHAAKQVSHAPKFMIAPNSRYIY